MSVIERLAERVARQEDKVAKETEKLEIYRNQLQTAMYQDFIKRQQNSRWTFDEALTQAFGQEEQPTLSDLPQKNVRRLRRYFIRKNNKSLKMWIM